MDLKIAGKTALVTGSTAGIGYAIAKVLAENGARVILNGRTQVSVDKAVAKLSERVPANLIQGIAADLGNAEGVNQLLKQCPDIDILVNNAGVNLPGTFHEVPNDIIQKTLQVNVAGMMYLSRACIPQMLKQKSGSIVNMSSINGLVSEPFLTVYSASKGAVVMFTRGVALDYAKLGIRCNAICPGWVDTPINYAHADLLGGIKKVYDGISVFQPIGRPGEPREIAHLVLFLASDEASWITGINLVVDGGGSVLG